jgi:Ser/Thr protein kinase RdoA (MazF antagonist)
VNVAANGLAAGGATDLFLALTPDRVLAAVEAAGLSCTGLCYPLNSFENRVYEVELRQPLDATADDEATGKKPRIIAKFYRPGRWSAEQIGEEHAFLRELEEAELPVCSIQPFPDGATLHRIDDIFYSLSPRRGGRAPDELSDPQVHRLGRLVALLHNVGARRDAPTRRRLDAEHYAATDLAWLERHRTVPPHLWSRYRTAGEAIARAVRAGLRGVETHRIHADLHLGNILDRDGQLRLLDFDDMAIGPAVQDLWLALPGRDPETLRRRELFLESYGELRRFERATLRLIEPLRGLRMLHYATWLARRWHDPAFHVAWPHFGTDDYWDQETRDLEEQVEIIEGDIPVAHSAENPAEPPPPPSEEELELTNKDFFWDWEGD